MYAFISGKVYSVKSDEVIVDNHGIGYRIHMSDTRKIKRDSEVFLYIYEQISEDAHTLYGFFSNEEYDLISYVAFVCGIS